VLPLLPELIEEAGAQVPLTQRRTTSSEEATQATPSGLPEVPAQGLIRTALTASQSPRETS
jgi:hypothetical protein